MGRDKAAAFAGKKICKEILHLWLQLVLFGCCSFILLIIMLKENSFK